MSDDKKSEPMTSNDSKSTDVRKVSAKEKLERWLDSRHYGQSSTLGALPQTKKGRGRHSW